MIGWILSKDDAKGLIMYNVKDKGYASFTPIFIAKAYNFLALEVNMNATDCINSLIIDYIGIAKMMTTEGKSFQQRASREYETTILRTRYKLVALMLNRILGRSC